MSWFPSPASPRELWSDIRAFAQDRSPHQWFAMAMAVVMPALTIFVFYLDSKDRLLPKEQVIYVENWQADRSDAEIKAAQAERQAANEKRAKAKQQMFKDLERKFGM